jgi:hypothetical protein
MEEQEDEAIFQIETTEDRAVIKLLREPEDDRSKTFLHKFFLKHKQLLQNVKKRQSLLILMDFQMLSASPSNLLYVQDITTHFRTIKLLSEEKIKACAVVVGSDFIASLINAGIQAFPGSVPTLVCSDLEKAKQYLRSHRQKIFN